MRKKKGCYLFCKLLAYMIYHKQSCIIQYMSAKTILCTGLQNRNWLWKQKSQLRIGYYIFSHGGFLLGYFSYETLPKSYYKLEVIT